MRLLLASFLALALALTGCLDDVIGGDDGPGPRDYASSKDYTTWIIEMDVTEGITVPAASLSLLQDRLEAVVNKPGGIQVKRGDALPAHNGPWTQSQVLAADRDHSDLKTGGETVVLHLLVLDGSYEAANVLGVTYTSQTSGGKVVASGPIAIFADSIHDAACPPPLGLCNGETGIWSAVLVHEFGHALGLVNNGAPMQRDHEDEGHPGHSSNVNSVMYWEVETVNVVNVFRGGPPTTFDVDDRADLCALGGKC